MKNRGLTLTELIISSILIMVIMLGVVSFNFAVKNIGSSSSKSALLAIRTQAAMNHLAHHAALATGYKENRGIQFDNNVGPEERSWISFREDQNKTMENYEDDRWNIFVTDQEIHRLYQCEQKEEEGGAIPDLNGKCNPQRSDIFVLSDEIYKSYFDLVINEGNAEFYIDIQLETRSDPAKGDEPLKNPSYKTSSRIIPAQHSW